jgi:hypothetical protein
MPNIPGIKIFMRFLIEEADWGYVVGIHPEKSVLSVIAGRISRITTFIGA